MALQKGFLEKEVTKLKWQNEHNTKRYTEKILKLENQLKEADNTIELLHQGKKIRPLLNNDVKKDEITAKLLQSIEISKIGNCRVLAFCPLLQQVVVSQPSGNTLFAGFGVRLLNTVDFKPDRFIYVQNKVIRDLAFHGEDRGLLLSVSLDHTAKLLDITSGSIVHTFRGDGPQWSCCWDVANPHGLLVGSQLGKVWMYDRRMMDAHVNVWENYNKTPVVALTSAPAVAGSPFPQGGFISCRLNGVYAYIRNAGNYTCQELPVEGPFMSMRYNYSSQSLLTCARPSSRCPHTQVSLNLLELDARHNICLPQIHTFNCGSTARVLSRINVFPTINDSLVVAHHESGRAINMWSTKHGELVNTFPTRDPVIDLAPLPLSNNKCLLAALSDRKVDIYKVT